MDALSEIKEKFPMMPVIMMSGHGTIETAVKSTKLGAFDFIEKPLNLDKVLLEIDHALSVSRLKQENIFLKDRASRQTLMQGRSAWLTELKEQLKVIAPRGRFWRHDNHKVLNSIVTLQA